MFLNHDGLPRESKSKCFVKLAASRPAARQCLPLPNPSPVKPCLDKTLSIQTFPLRPTKPLFLNWKVSAEYDRAAFHPVRSLSPSFRFKALDDQPIFNLSDLTFRIYWIRKKRRLTLTVTIKMPRASRTVSEADWERHGDTITRLYHVERLRLHGNDGQPSVQQVMRDEYGFDAR